MEAGINRIRISAGDVDGKYSQFSDSIFIEVDGDIEEQENSESTSFPGLFEVAIIVIMIVILVGWRR